MKKRNMLPLCFALIAQSTVEVGAEKLSAWEGKGVQVKSRKAFEKMAGMLKLIFCPILSLKSTITGYQMS